MSYLKLPKTCSDHPVGFQSVNQAIDNNAEVYAQLDKRHSVIAEGNAYVAPFRAPGTHDDVLIARTVADFAYSSSLLRMWPYISGPMIFGLPTRRGVGSWDIQVTAPRIYAASVTIRGVTALIPRAATCHIYRGLNSAYVSVRTWNVAAGALADYDFSLAVWTDSLV